MFRRKPDYEKIALLEDALGLTDEALQQRAFEARKNLKWKERGGAVELDAKPTAWASAISIPTTIRVITHA